VVIPLGGGWRTAFAGAITNLTAGGGDLDPVEMEAAFAGFDEEQLGVWVTMERWTLTGAIDQSQRFGHAVVGADELVHARQRGSAAARKCRRSTMLTKTVQYSAGGAIPVDMVSAPAPGSMVLLTRLSRAIYQRQSGRAATRRDRSPATHRRAHPSWTQGARAS